MKSAAQNTPDPVQLRPNISGRYPGDFSDRRRIHALEIQEHQFTIGRPQAMNELQEIFQGHLFICHERCDDLRAKRRVRDAGRSDDQQVPRRV